MMRPVRLIYPARRLCDRFGVASYSSTLHIRQYSNQKEVEDIDALLATPTWSVRSLLSSPDSVDASTVTSKQLHHLLRLSALPAPKDEAEERQMLDTLRSQLHFVKHIQQVDTEGVEPLRVIRDETPGARKEEELTFEHIRDAVEQEERLAGGRIIRRGYRKSRDRKPSRQSIDMLSKASRRRGNYFVVESGIPQGDEKDS